MDTDDNCASFYDFKKSTFVTTNPCYDNDENIDVLSWESGTFTEKDGVLTLTTKEGYDTAMV
jgi:hypothetical protein